MSKIPGFRSGKLWKKVVAVIGYTLLAIIVLGALTGDNDNDNSKAPSVVEQGNIGAPESEQSAPSSQTQPTEQPKKAESPTYKAGMYKVGSDLPAGEYVLIPNGSGYFEISSDSTGQLASIIANDNFSGRSIVSVSDAQYFKLTRCTAYPIASAPKVSPENGELSDGMYKVGVDLPSGEYKVIGSSAGSYLEVSRDSTHRLSSIISNDIFEGERYITINDGQYIKLNRATIKVQ